LTLLEVFNSPVEKRPIAMLMNINELEYRTPLRQKWKLLQSTGPVPIHSWRKMCTNQEMAVGISTAADGSEDFRRCGEL
jgi:hypothetical protein